MEKTEIAGMIDHGILAPQIDDNKILEELNRAIENNVASVCIKPYAVMFAAKYLKETNVKVGTVVGFPHGSNSIKVKVIETMDAIENGAQEIDMVVNIGKVLSEDWDYITKEIGEVTRFCKMNDVVIKVIFETTYLKDELIVQLCKICTQAGVDYVKTSTGFDFVKDDKGSFYTIGATVAQCELMKKNVGEAVGIKASGGIKNLQQAEALIKAGATRLGTSSTEQILK